MYKDLNYEELSKMSIKLFEQRKVYDKAKDRPNIKSTQAELEKVDHELREKIKLLDLSELYSNEVSKEHTRANRGTRYYRHHLWKTVPFAEKERWGIDLVTIALRGKKNPVVSCSFGIDSIVTLYIVRKALIELGRDPSEIQVIWNDTLNEFPEVRKYALDLTNEWGLNLIISKPKKPLKKIISEHGGVDSSYFFTRKGDRSNGRPLSEKCCGTLKHEPMKRSIKENNWI